MEWICFPPHRLKSYLLRSSEGGVRRQRGQTGVTQAFLSKRPFLVASGLLRCQRQDHRNRFFFFKCGMETRVLLGIRLSLAWGERWDSALTMRAKFLWVKKILALFRVSLWTLQIGFCFLEIAMLLPCQVLIHTLSLESVKDVPVLPSTNTFTAQEPTVLCLSDQISVLFLSLNLQVFVCLLFRGQLQ